MWEKKKKNQREKRNKHTIFVVRLAGRNIKKKEKKKIIPMELLSDPVNDRKVRTVKPPVHRPLSKELMWGKSNNVLTYLKIQNKDKYRAFRLFLWFFSKNRWKTWLEDN